ncbi:hypothetical protein O0I10_004503 [Lichtheimia ornata]|uniref:Myb-like domain-containing protein n=1 Tax=Lichtheimia ornata TaxID=688661 RepID=A0AAD7V7V1_9FUNG|nr:uncharacterized protein O0I10_004503 [Lichtheimia ornata]KAJ8659910.1 hypothetical protein O0I10_004503 [Lichtheimia ornata]
MAPRGRIQNDSNEAKRWLVVGAFQAGASERTVARISGLSSTAVRQIYLNYRQTGIPSLPKHLSRKVREKLVVEYDEEGNLLDDSSDDEQETNEVPKPSTSKIARLPSTKDVIAYVVDQVHQSPVVENTNDRIHERSPSTSIEDPGTPSLVASSPSSSTSGHWRPLTPPRDSSSDEKSPALKQHESFLPPSPPLHATTAINNKQVITKSKLPPVRKYNQTIRGYERWTHDDDKILMEYILKRMRGDNWYALSAKFGGRHSSSCCKQRWEYLQKRLLKNLTKTNTTTTTTNNNIDRMEE